MEQVLCSINMLANNRTQQAMFNLNGRHESFYHLSTVTLMSGLQNVQSESINWLEQQASMAESTEDIRNQLAGLAEAVTGLIDWHQRVKVELGTQISSLMAAIEIKKQFLKS